MLKVILLCLILITPTLVLYQNYTVLNANYGKLTDNYDKLTINFIDLEDSFEKLDKENQQLGNENQQLGNDLNLLIEDYEKSKTLLDKLEQLLENTNKQKTELESEIKTKSSEISQLIEDGNAKQSAINSLNDDLTVAVNEIETLDELSIALESEIFSLTNNIEDQKQTISNLENIENELKRQKQNLIEEKQNLIEENEILNDNNTKLSLLLSESILGQRDEIYRIGNDMRKSVVLVSDHNSYGTGFFVSNNGCILTNAHVTDGNSRVTIELSDGKKYSGTVLKEGNAALNNRANSNQFDLALIKIDVTSTPIPINVINPSIDEMIILVGHPGELGTWVIAAGTYNGNANYIPSEHSFSLPSVFGGSSGSPIVNMNGELVGVNWGSGLDDPLNQNDNIVVWKDNLGKLIMDNQHSIAETSASAITFLSDTQCRIT